MITEKGLLRMAEAIYGLMDSVRVVFDDDSIINVRIHKHEIKADTIRLMGLLDNTVTGRMREVQVVDSDGVVLLSNPHSFVKTDVYGLLVVFTLRIVEVM